MIFTHNTIIGKTMHQKILVFKLDLYNISVILNKYLITFLAFIY